MKRLLASLTLAILASTSAHAGPTAHREDYRHLTLDRHSGMPQRIVLRHCEPQEDTLARLRLKVYDPGVKAVYRCVTP